MNHLTRNKKDVMFIFLSLCGSVAAVAVIGVAVMYVLY